MWRVSAGTAENPRGFRRGFQQETSRFLEAPSPEVRHLKAQKSGARGPPVRGEHPNVPLRVPVFVSAPNHLAPQNQPFKNHLLSTPVL